MFILLKNLMLGPYGVFWQVIFAGLVLLIGWWSIDSGTLFSLVSNLISWIILFLGWWYGEYQEDWFLGVVLVPFIMMMVGSFIFMVGFFLFTFISHPFDVTKELVNLAIQELWPKLFNAILTICKFMLLFGIAGVVFIFILEVALGVGFENVEDFSPLLLLVIVVTIVVCRNWVFEQIVRLIRRAFPRA